MIITKLIYLHPKYQIFCYYEFQKMAILEKHQNTFGFYEEFESAN